MMDSIKATGFLFVKGLNEPSGYYKDTFISSLLLTADLSLLRSSRILFWKLINAENWIFSKLDFGFLPIIDTLTDTEDSLSKNLILCTIPL